MAIRWKSPSLGPSSASPLGRNDRSVSSGVNLDAMEVAATPFFYGTGSEEHERHLGLWERRAHLLRHQSATPTPTTHLHTESLPHRHADRDPDHLNHPDPNGSPTQTASPSMTPTGTPPPPRPPPAPPPDPHFHDDSDPFPTPTPTYPMWPGFGATGLTSSQSSISKYGVFRRTSNIKISASSAKPRVVSRAGLRLRLRTWAYESGP
jgi:hypothetical protein